MGLTEAREIDAGTVDAPVWAFDFVFKAFGVVVRIECTDRQSLERAAAIARKSFIERIEVLCDPPGKVDHSLGIARTGSGSFELWENGAFRSATDKEEILFKFFTSYLRLIVAERAKDFVFVHAGVVGYKGRTIVIPGNSHTGKTTLVAELVGCGAEYFSDEYAVLDPNGLVHPYARDLSVRKNGDWEDPVLVPAETVGTVATSPAAAGLVLITEFRADTDWKPERLSVGNGMKEMIPHTIPIRLNTEFSMKVLKAVASRAIILKGSRPDARSFARILLSFIDNDLYWSEMT